MYQFKVLNKVNNLEGRKLIDNKLIIKHLIPFPKEMQRYEIDHIFPLSKFNLKNSEEVRKAFAPENHRWLIKWKNKMKRSFTDEEFKNRLAKSIMGFQ